MNESIHIIACSVFKDALAYLTGRTGPPVSVTYLPSALHLKPGHLKQRLLNAVRQAKKRSSCVGCLYGQCFPDIDRFLVPTGVSRIDCGHCYEAFLGHRRYGHIVKEHPGTFFAEKELLLNFDELCRIPLELDDPEMRDMQFRHYRQVIYIRQPLDPDLTGKARSVADSLKLRLEIADADYTVLEEFISELCR